MLFQCLGYVLDSNLSLGIAMCEDLVHSHRISIKIEIGWILAQNSHRLLLLVLPDKLELLNLLIHLVQVHVAKL